MSASAEFKRQLGADVVNHLGRDYSFKKSKLLISKPMPNCTLAASLSGSNRFSPYIGIEFYFGVAFSQLGEVERRLGRSPSPMHLCQFTPNCQVRRLGPYTGPCSWSIDIQHPPANLDREVAEAISGLAIPFAEAYGTLAAARDAIVSNDPCVLGGWIAWRSLLYVDFVLDDLEHFESWSRILEPFDLQQAKDEMQKLVGIGQ